ncbi:DUF2946 family protein [Azonexus sp. R2A61]|uniref:DUF2946 family protein n=1 Tax=Azonexus sp. R2A61 TaxID=2744443 RepID=UPI001F28D411|nr:DUF2946 family protein [Azonexus sp. R2A61]
MEAAASIKWPNVPACYEWLSLDRRGNWRLQGEPLTHRGLIAFLNAHYAVDDRGCGYVQNGPQRVYVDLACTPWIYRRHGQGFISHVGGMAGDLRRLLIDGQGNLLLDAAPGIGLLDDRDLAPLIDEIRRDQGGMPDDTDWQSILDGRRIALNWHGIPLEPVEAAALAGDFGFNPRPRPAAAPGTS